MGHIIHESASYALTELFGHFSREADGVTAIAIDPRWVKTDMGGRNARLEPEESARGLLRVIDGLTPRDSGRFFRYDGSEVPW